jgi:hypothetical protein
MARDPWGSVAHRPLIPLPRRRCPGVRLPVFPCLPEVRKPLTQSQTRTFDAPSFHTEGCSSYFLLGVRVYYTQKKPLTLAAFDDLPGI